MFDTILDNLNSIQNEMVAMFKQQYEWEIGRAHV